MPVFLFCVDEESFVFDATLFLKHAAAPIAMAAVTVVPIYSCVFFRLKRRIEYEQRQKIDSERDAGERHPGHYGG